MCVYLKLKLYFLKFIFKKGDSGSWETPEQLTFTCLVVWIIPLMSGNIHHQVHKPRVPVGGRLCRINLQSLSFGSFLTPWVP